MALPSFRPGLFQASSFSTILMISGPLTLPRQRSGRRWIAHGPLGAVAASLLMSSSPAFAADAVPAPQPANVSPTTASLTTEAPPGPKPAQPVFGLPELVRMTLEGSASLAAERARVQAAESAVVSARALPNPELEVSQGRLGARVTGVRTGGMQAVTVTQPLELPSLRRARADAAGAALDSSRSGVNAYTLDLLAQMKLRFYEVLHREAEWRSAQEDLALANQIRDRVKLRVEQGEAPRYELLRADTERLNALRRQQSAQLRIDQARGDLRRLVGGQLPEVFEVNGSLAEALLPPPPLEKLREDLLAGHPQLVAARAEVRASQARLELERSRRLPAVAVRGSAEREPETRANRLGLVMTLPLWDRRAGPIGEAQADVQRARAVLSDLELQLTQALSMAARQYEIAAGQVSAFENGIVREAEAALKVAESAYRYGERGILDFLDAQRSLRLARNELNAARLDQRAALVELERLSATQP